MEGGKRDGGGEKKWRVGKEMKEGKRDGGGEKILATE